MMRHKKAIFWALHTLIGLAYFSSYILYNFIPEDKHVFGLFSSQQNPYPEISENEYLDLLGKKHRDVVLMDVRKGHLIPGNENERFANSFYDIDNQEDVNNYILTNKEKLKGKDIVFICYGGFEARIFQKRTEEFLKRKKLDMNILAFESSFMLQNTPAWKVQRMHLLPNSLIEHWNLEGSLAIYSLKGENWAEIKKDLKKYDGKTLIKSNLSPSHIEKNLYPLVGIRYYPEKTWKTPPKILAKVVYFFKRFMTENGMLIFFFAVFFLFQGVLARLSHKYNSKKIPLIRSILTVTFVAITFYYPFCFLENFSHPDEIHFPYYIQSFLFFIFLFRSAYNGSNGTRYLSTFDKNIKLWNFQIAWFFWPLLFGLSRTIVIESWVPHHTFSKLSITSLIILCAYSPIMDFLFYQFYKLRNNSHPLSGRPNPVG